MKSDMEIKKGQYYVCIKDVVMDDKTIGYSQGKCYCSDKQYYLVDNNGFSNFWQCTEMTEHFRPATPDEILIGRALTEEQQLFIKEIKLKIKLGKIELMKCGLSEDEAIEQVDMVLKAAFKEVFYPKK